MKHLRHRVLIQILIPTLSVFLLMTMGSYLFYLGNYRNSVIEKKQTEFMNVSRLFSDWISGRMRELMLLKNLDILKEGDTPDTRVYLKSELGRRIYQFSDFWMIRPSGRYWTTAGQEGVLSEQRPLVQIFRGEKLFLYQIPERNQRHEAEPFVLFGVPVVKGGEVVCILGGTVNVSELNWLLDLYTGKMFDSTALINLETSELHTTGGVLVAHSDASQNGKTEVDLYGREISSNSYQKNESFFVTSLINNWKFIGRIGNGNLFFEVGLLSRIFIQVLGILIVVIIILSIGISQLISGPVLSLTHMVNRMLQGDFNNTISIDTNDELSSLAEAFNLLNKQNIQLRTNDRFSFLGRISSRMAHEIRHPLHVIQIAVQTLNCENYTKNRDIIVQEITKAEMFIREVLEIARPNELSLKYYSMSALAENINRKFSLLAAEKKVSLALVLDAEYSQFYFDILKIEQVLTNILNNSFDVTPPGGVITLKVENDEDKQVRVCISDTGPGFDPKTLDRVFDPYYTTKENGTGLGLSICYQILAAHGANIELANGPQGGALTRITFSSQPDK